MRSVVALRHGSAACRVFKARVGRGFCRWWRFWARSRVAHGSDTAFAVPTPLVKKALDNRWSRGHSGAQGSGGPRILPMLAVLGEAAGGGRWLQGFPSSYAHFAGILAKIWRDWAKSCLTDARNRRKLAIAAQGGLGFGRKWRAKMREFSQRAFAVLTSFGNSVFPCSAAIASQ